MITTANIYAAYFKAEGSAYAVQVIANPSGTPSASVASIFNVAGVSSVAPTIAFPTNEGTVKLSAPQVNGNVTVGWSPVPGATLYEYLIAPQGFAPVATGVSPGLLVSVPLKVLAAGQKYSVIARSCPAGKVCPPGTNTNWGPWSTVAGPGGNNFTVVP